MFIKNFAATNLSWKQFYIKISYIISIVGVLFISCSLFYFLIKYRKWNKNEEIDDASIKEELQLNQEEDEKEEIKI